jgi:hypothetical protein
MPSEAPAKLEIPSDPRGAAILIAHADRFWKAEEANAARLSTRANFVLSGIYAIIGFKTFAVGRELDRVLAVPTGFWFVLYWIASGTTVVLLVFALVRALGSGQRKRQIAPAASDLLRLRDSVINRPWNIEEVEASWYVFKTTYNAATDLNQRNKRRIIGIDRAQRLLFFGIITLILSIVVYTFAVRGGANGELAPAAASQPTP